MRSSRADICVLGLLRLCYAKLLALLVGNGALEVNIHKGFDIGRVEDLGTGTFSADAAQVNAVAAEGGKVKMS